jgi:hypothetical protein
VHRNPLARRRAAHRVLAAAAAAAALVAAQPAGAQPRKEPATRTAPRATPASVPAAAPAALAAKPAATPLPPPPAAASPRPRRVGTLAVSAGPWAGFDLGESVAIQVDYGFLRTPQTWTKLELEVRLAVMIAHPTGDTAFTTVVVPPYGTPVEVSSGAEKMSAWVIEAVPTVRLRLPVNPKFALFADGGLGVAQTIESYEREEMYLGESERTQNVTGLVLRLGAGMAFQLSERTRVVFLPLALSIQLGPDFSAFAPTLGVAYRL